jgi:HD-GYP domain-containing protein (c-di-GMP phosphodiesterase class II)
MNKKNNCRVFVASTWEDLKNERIEVLEALRQFYFQHVNMEYFGADPRQSIEKCFEEVQSADIFVGIIGSRYGSILNTTGKSYTQMEYEEAIRSDLPCLIYIRSEDVPIPPKYFERNPNSIKMLEDFKSILRTKHTVASFRYSSDLAIRVSADLTSQVQKMESEKRSELFPVELSSSKLIAVIDSYLDKVNNPDELLTGIVKHYGFYTESDTKKIREEIYKLSESIIKTLSETVEMRDPYTVGHQNRVADLARAIATEMNLPADQINGIRMTAAIHDLGKISVPAEILSKPSKLTLAEFNLIKNHPQSGYDMLKDINFPWPIARTILEHHERMNGSGYPNGLRGDNILVESRILSVADDVESMVSHRPYRPSLGIQAALEYIEKNRGTLYDNPVVDACLILFREKNYHLMRVP